MVLSAMYMSMLCTNWGNVNIFDNTTDFFSHSEGSYWLKVSAEWITMSLYIFSQLAPILFPGRDFN